MTASAADIPAKLLDWYDRHARDLPWRARPGKPAPDPYHVWLSEVMLQQTTVAAVKPYFAKFLAIWPTVESLAAAPEEEVMAAWAGLGYYSRARNLVKAARAVAALGAFPAAEDELRKLPGLGAYTAAAVAAIAFGQRAVVVDANVERVVARLFTIDEPLPGARKAIRHHVETITPEDRAGDFAQAMMDLGSAICTTRAPKCLLCPLAADCGARLAGYPERYPVKPPKQAKPERVGHAWWIADGDRVLLVRRAGTGMLGGMRALPDDGWTARANGSGQPPVGGEWRECGTVRHGFTHANLTLHVRALEHVRVSAVPDGEWWPLADLDNAGLPTLFAKAARLALAEV
uniref:A/G-specific adenine glycosylase n=1 Tax=Parerythrobacter lutipelagi TaxID=1964208 RepID=UPI0010F4FBEA|nr:A/G-specific adenine glycosylase [Parerythrobacter lutipelagi]